MNRFSSDIDVLDQKIPRNAMEGIWCLVKSLVTMVFVAYHTPFLLIPFALVAIVAVILQMFFGRTKRQLKRLESVNKSPIFALFSETVQGTHVIRAYGQQKRFIREIEVKIDRV